MLKQFRQQMRKILAESGQPAWLDAAAKSLLRDAQRQYLELNLSAQSYAVEGTTVYLFLWESDQVQKAVVALLIGQGLTAQNFGMGVQVTHTTLVLVIEALTRIAAQPCPLPEKIIQRKRKCRTVFFGIERVERHDPDRRKGRPLNEAD